MELEKDTKPLTHHMQEADDVPPQYSYPPPGYAMNMAPPPQRQYVMNTAPPPPQQQHHYAMNTTPPAPTQSTTQNTVIVSQPAAFPTVVVQSTPQMSGGTIGLTILYSCIVFWCCCWPLGCAAFFVAISATSTDTADNRAKIRTANILSSVGLGIGLISIILVVVYIFVIAATAENEWESNDYDSHDYDAAIRH